MVPEITLVLRHAPGSGIYLRFVTCANNDHDACLPQCLQVFIGRFRRVFQPLPDAARTLDHQDRFEAHLVHQKRVWVLRLNAVRLQRAFGKILEVEGNDYICLSSNGGRKDMPVVRVRKGEGGDEVLLAALYGVRFVKQIRHHLFPFYFCGTGGAKLAGLRSRVA
jgi:hypothetical protein